MLFILFILFVVFVLYPLGVALWRGYQLNKSWKRATEGFRNAYQRAAGNQTQKPKPKKKKIDPNVGEYVAFEEIKVESTTYTETTTEADGTTTTYVHTESQIEDAVWEDIK